MISEIISPGTKAGLCMASGSRIYKSEVTAIFDNGELELLMPEENGKPVMLPIRKRFELVFYVSENLYRGAGMIEERYKADNRYMLRVSLKSQLRRSRHNEYSCISCGIEAAYYEISKEQAQETDSVQYQMLAEKLSAGGMKRNGFAAGISGDGAQLVTETHIQEDSYILMQFRLRIDADAKHYLFPAYISSVIIDKSRACFVSRAEFMIKDRNVQEEIIRYIFDEERKNRMRERSPDAL